MKRLLRNSVLVIVAALSLGSLAPAAQAQESTKKERNYIRSGNKLFNDKRYAEAEVEYNKALQENPQSAVATFNLATTLLRQGGGTAAKDDKNNPAVRAQGMLEQLVKTSNDPSIVSKSYYDLGNIAYAAQDYGKAIEMYKNALRRNPDYDHARDNLRLAQLKKQEQDKNKNDQNQDKDKNKDQQDKDKDKNQDQNKDQNKDQDKNKDQNQQNKDQQQQQQQQGGMSQQNAEQILKTMQDKENSTQQRVQAVQAQQQQRERSRTSNKW